MTGLAPTCEKSERYSASHVLRIKRARPRDVVGPLDNGPAVGKNGELKAIGREPEHERVVADGSQTTQSRRQLVEVERSRASHRDLDRIAPAEGRRVRPHPPFEPFEPPLHAAGTIDLAEQPRHLELP